jgi:hypothetical protein
MDNLPLKVGAKVKIVGFPSPTDPFNVFDYNGKVGEIKSAYKVGRGLNDVAVYAYDVFFKDVEVPHTERSADGRLVRSMKLGEAFQQFDECYLQRVE